MVEPDLSVYCLLVVAFEPQVWLNQVLRLIYPDICQICCRRGATHREGYVCGECWRGVRFIQTPFCARCGLPFEGRITTRFECANCRELDLHFDSARSAVLARGLVLEVIHRYKYHHAHWFEAFLADLLIRRAGPVLSPKEWDMIIPVPLHPVRRRERGFNQAHRLATHLSRAAGLPLHAHCLRRIRPTNSQTLLSRKGRASNMHGAFSLCPGATVEGASCVLVDDVLTTGATASACSRELRAAGARRVCVWTVARGV